MMHLEMEVLEIFYGMNGIKPEMEIRIQTKNQFMLHKNHGVIVLLNYMIFTEEIYKEFGKNSII